jgi:hypothetical protein
MPFSHIVLNGIFILEVWDVSLRVTLDGGSSTSVSKFLPKRAGDSAAWLCMGPERSAEALTPDRHPGRPLLG